MMPKAFSRSLRSGTSSTLLAGLLLIAAACGAAPTTSTTNTGGTSGTGPITAPASGPFEVVEATIPEMQAALAAGRVTSVELVAMYQARIAAYDANGPKLNSISVLNPQAAEEARLLDAERKAGKVRGPLHGIPVIVKDNYETSNMQMAGGSSAWQGYIPQRDAFLVTKLKEAGAIIVAKANMDEFGLGISGGGSLYGQSKNPYALDRIPGGSSSGPAIAIAANLAAVALGSDTCGSIRMPAAHTALVGLRATQGLLSRSGIIPLGHSQDMGAPIGRTVTDVAIMLDSLVGYDPKDGQTAEAFNHYSKSYAAALDAGALRGARIGLVTTLVGGNPEYEEVAGLIRKAAEDMKAAGATVVDVPIETINSLTAGDRFRGFMVPPHEFRADLAAYVATLPNKPPVTTIPELLANGPPPLATHWMKISQSFETLDDVEYKDALLRRPVLRQLLVQKMADNNVDVLIWPTYQVKPGLIAGKEKAGYNNCAIGSGSGLPSISVPAGWTPDELPIGMEMMARPYDEERLLKLAYSFEQATHHRRSPDKNAPPLPAAGAAAAPAAPAAAAPAPAAK